MGQPREAAALQHGDVLPYGVDLPYIRTAPEEVSCELLQVSQLDGRRRIREQRRRPARDQGEQQISLPQGPGQILYLPRRLHAPFVRLGMGGEDGLEVPRTRFVAVFGDY